MTGKSHDEFMIEQFRADPAFAAELLNDILADGDDQGELDVLLRQMAAAFGVDSGASGQSIGSLTAILRAMGLRLSAAPAQVKPRRRAANTPKRTAHRRRTAAKVPAAV